MARNRGMIETLVDGIKDALSGAMGTLAPQPDVVPVPVRDDPRHDPRRR
ncbi:hypothetical protein [Jannaschia ovalis]|uniref:Uncharacterized protein n=1 Tax=Jannaschia ovalis TaxID=3038773 RepID=A0ABY8LEC8_9RHOB|nr:hypothetical protein [Jannaschia sp. GRR-S6-38]WGH79675.1 hypothetical protein P8627_05270 [Jannaschia sp. GRR-S6-38]